MSPKEKELMGFVRNYWENNYCAPTYKEIAQGLEVKSQSHIHFLIKGLVTKGFLVKKGSRTVRPADLTLKSLDKKL